MTTQIMDVRLNLIKIEDRARKDLGAIDLLAASIDHLGLLQPIGIDQNYRLVFGERRYRAFELLGRETIPARIVHVDSLLQAEHAENEIRKDFTPEERVAIARAIEDELKAMERRGRPKAETGQGELIESEIPAYLPELRGRETRDIAAERAGFESTTTYRQARKVTEEAERELIDAMNRGDIAISTAATLLKADTEAQKEAAADPRKAIELAKAISIKNREIKEAAKIQKQAESREKKQSRINDIKAQAALIAESSPDVPVGPFHVISIDPPWPYGTEYDPHGRRAANPYPEMSLEDIAGLSIPAADDCVLWLWTTHKFMRHSFGLIDQWGFRDVAILTWVKDRMGLGSWLRSQTEYCIMAVKGSPPIQLTNQTTVIHGPLREHSRKPDAFFDMVDGLCVGAKLDYFSREKRDGWAQVGNTTDLFTQESPQ